jgi:hypothetical protein
MRHHREGKDRALQRVIDRLIRIGVPESIAPSKGYSDTLLVPFVGPLYQKASVNCNLQQHEPLHIATCNLSNLPYIATTDPLNTDPINPEILKATLRFFGATDGGEFWKVCLHGHAASAKAGHHGEAH